MNKVVLIGRLTRDPELKFTPGNGTAVTSITLAVDKYNSATKQREADFISVTIWGKQAEATANYMTKGSLMAISGRIQTRTYDDKEGNKRYVTEVVANETSFLSSKGNGAPGGANQTGNSISSWPEDDMVPVVDDGDIPF
ncbi:single-stranded DNA-binding protein [Clostridium intestinale]|uniref:Single-stranded DNA-binding protein n=1 Tax=Clostridium intestinale TaxID=36845 RepID=A0A7D7A2B6_9CLOT|nr:single-stranded DNA-binding protein [Clostridium intestinale]QLY79198.1 single-stranded DNA-binding protein [Clostridium intestinale]